VKSLKELIEGVAKAIGFNWQEVERVVYAEVA
jgi:hypothetical protein